MNPVYKTRFRKQLGKLPMQIRKKFYERLGIFLENKFNPILENHSVDPIYPNCRSINVTGDHRAIFYETGNKVVFIAIGTHPQLYK